MFSIIMYLNVVPSNLNWFFRLSIQLFLYNRLYNLHLQGQKYPIITLSCKINAFFKRDRVIHFLCCFTTKVFTAIFHNLQLLLPLISLLEDTCSNCTQTWENPLQHSKHLLCDPTNLLQSLLRLSRFLPGPLSSFPTIVYHYSSTCRCFLIVVIFYLLTVSLSNPLYFHYLYFHLLISFIVAF